MMLNVPAVTPAELYTVTVTIPAVPDGEIAIAGWYGPDVMFGRNCARYTLPAATVIVPAASAASPLQSPVVSFNAPPMEADFMFEVAKAIFISPFYVFGEWPPFHRI